MTSHHEPGAGRQGRWAGRLLALAVAVYAWALALNRSLRRVEGQSMQATLWQDDRIVVVPSRLRRARRGDVVLADDPDDPQRTTCKRVVGLPGERIELRDGQLLIDGVPRHEPYVAVAPCEHGSWLVPAAHLLLLGDNRLGSTDGRVHGPVPASTVRAVGVLSLTPWRPRLRQPPRAAPHVAATHVATADRQDPSTTEG